jgi:hypothetical protein
MGSAIAAWDYNTQIKATRTIVVDTDAIRSDCQLGHDAMFRIAVVAESGGSGIRNLSYRHNLSVSESPEEITVETNLENDSLSGSLLILTILTLVDPGDNSGQFSPVTNGNILWKDSHSILLEGGGSRFPMEIIDFTEVGWLPAGSGWYLDWDRELLDHPFMGSVRLYINKSHRRVVKAVSSNTPDEEDKAVLSALYYDTGRSLISGSLLSSEFMGGTSDWAEGSTGYVLKGMFKTFFPGETREGLLNKMNNDSETFNAVVRERFELFGYG